MSNNVVKIIGIITAAVVALAAFHYFKFTASISENA